jgi:S-DNA-T family DNA segregation ATPase FtsK/SpoIIIE
VSKQTYIFIDNVDKIKKLEYDNWYRSIVNTSQGIWLGNGIADQFSLKLVKIGKELYYEIGKNFGYVVKRGLPILVKFIEDEDSEDEVL